MIKSILAVSTRAPARPLIQEPARLAQGDGERQSVGWLKFDEYKDELILLAKLGLQYSPNYLEIAQSALAELRLKVVRREGGRVKNGYIRRLGSYVAVATVLLILIRCLVGGSLSTTKLDWAWAIYNYRNFALLLTGSMLGMWLSFLLRKVILTFSDLEALEVDRLNPLYRMIFVALLTLIVGLIFSTGMVNMQIGSFTTDLLDNGSFALLIGLFCGIGEQAVAVSVRRRADEFVGRIGGETTGT